jgi:hypothetical protein
MVTQKPKIKYIYIFNMTRNQTSVKLYTSIKTNIYIYSYYNTYKLNKTWYKYALLYIHFK